MDSPEIETDDFAKFVPLSASWSQLKTIYELIEAHYHEAIALKDVVKHFGFSATYLTELYTYKFLITP
jgi:YesN/AraC family two-component response regulator